MQSSVISSLAYYQAFSKEQQCGYRKEKGSKRIRAMIVKNVATCLQQEVLRQNLCVGCGACLGNCPYLRMYKGKVVLLDQCNLCQGQCYEHCPRTHLDLDGISQKIFGLPYGSDEIGMVTHVFMARSTDAAVKVKAQYGGTVTALICFALDEGFIDTAVLTLSEDKSSPEGILVSTKEGVLNCAGSSYLGTPTLEAFNRGTQDDNRRKIGVVGTPCQVQALAKMRTSTLDNRNNVDKLNLVIGLFCTWALAPDKFIPFLRNKVRLQDIIKLDIPPPPANVFEIYTSSQRLSVPLDEIRGFIMPSCAYCIDMTAEFSDISVGATEGISGWNTVIVRSGKGSDLVKAAEAKGIIEVDALPSENLKHLKEASLLKKRRAIQNIIEKTGDADDLLYLKVPPKVTKQLLVK